MCGLTKTNDYIKLNAIITHEKNIDLNYLISSLRDCCRPQVGIFPKNNYQKGQTSSCSSKMGWLGTNQSFDWLNGCGWTPTNQSENWMNSSKCTYEKLANKLCRTTADRLYCMSLLSQNGSEQSLNGLVCELQLKKSLQSFILWLLKQSGSGTCLLSTWSDKSTDPCRSSWSSSLRSVK